MNIKRYDVAGADYIEFERDHGRFVIFEDHEIVETQLLKDRDHWRDKYYYEKYGRTWTEMKQGREK